jgi:hypothetical protein
VSAVVLEPSSHAAMLQQLRLGGASGDGGSGGDGAATLQDALAEDDDEGEEEGGEEGGEGRGADQIVAEPEGGSSSGGSGSSSSILHPSLVDVCGVVMRRRGGEAGGGGADASTSNVAPVYITDDKFPDVCAALDRRGWQRCEHVNHPGWDLKWRNFTKVNFGTLRNHQLVNHLENANQLSNKGKLCLQLRQLRRRDRNADIMRYFPRTWLLSHPTHAAEFMRYAALDRARAVLQHGLTAAAVAAEATAEAAAAGVADVAAEATAHCDANGMAERLAARAAVAIGVVDDYIAAAQAARDKAAAVGTKAEKAGAPPSAAASQAALPPRPSLQVGGVQWGALFAAAAAGADADADADSDGSSEAVVLAGAAAALVSAVGVERARAALCALAQLDAQSVLLRAGGGGGGDSGAAAADGTSSVGGSEPVASVWVLKPVGEACGRGVRCLAVHSPAELLRAALEIEGAKAVCQKYIERPLLVRGHKFDIRQWVLVRSVPRCGAGAGAAGGGVRGKAPAGDEAAGRLDVWWWDSPYLRFALAPFAAAGAVGGQQKGAVDFSDSFAHLCNYAVQKDHEGAAEDSGDEGGGSDAGGGGASVPRMWSTERFRRFLRERDSGGCDAAADPWTTRVVPSIRNACMGALLAVCGARDGAMAAPRRARGGFEWLGFDLILDEQLGAWLLEVNVSPDMSHSTAVTAALVPAATEQLMQIVLGEGEGGGDGGGGGGWELGQASAPQSPRWELIRKGLPNPAAPRRKSSMPSRTRGKAVGKASSAGSAPADAAHSAQLQEWAALEV